MTAYLRRLCELCASWALAGGIIFLPVSSAVASRGYRGYTRRYYHHHHRLVHRSIGLIPLYHAALVEDADSGNILYSYNPTLQWPPASMAKMMLLLVAEDQIKTGRMSLNDPVRISERAAATQGSRLGLREGQIYPLGELMKAALIRSANDAAVAVAEKIAGSTEACVRMMNDKARVLGMNNTYYGTVDGLPPTPSHDVDYTTPLDLATLARAIIRSTGLLQWSSMEQAPFDGGVTMLYNTNRLIGHLEGCDGLKTGFTLNAGFNLTATAKRGDMRLVSVVLGAPSNRERFAQSARLLSWGFDNFDRVELLRRGEPLPVQVQVQSGGIIQPVSESDIAVVLPKGHIPEVKLKFDIPPSVSGPVAYGDTIGHITVLDGSEVMTTVDAICPLAKTGEQIQPVSSAIPAVHSILRFPFVGRSADAAKGSVPLATNPVEENR
ncbi:MAG: D-alanyl-D-alanine carboxypeptidase [Deltaproteobacteria bacterium]|nr:D-alanyl-D-alanine carboxypeptidase [Deltaproteobacteria bacterium]